MRDRVTHSDSNWAYDVADLTTLAIRDFDDGKSMREVNEKKEEKREKKKEVKQECGSRVRTGADWRELHVSCIMQQSDEFTRQMLDANTS